jgi:hypothetical protein
MLFDQFNFEVVNLAEYAPDEPPDPDSFGTRTEIEYDGIDLRPYCLSSTRKNLRVHDLDLDFEPARSIFKNYASGAVRLARATDDLIEDYDFEVALGGNSVYIYGVPLAVARNAGINSYVPATARLPKTEFVHKFDGFADIYEDTEYVLEQVPQRMDDERKNKVDFLMESRKKGYHQDVDPMSGSMEASNQTTVCVFTNLIWDGSLEGEGEGMTGVLEWLAVSIEELMGSEEVDLIIDLEDKFDIDLTTLKRIANRIID